MTTVVYYQLNSPDEPAIKTLEDPMNKTRALLLLAIPVILWIALPVSAQVSQQLKSQVTAELKQRTLRQQPATSLVTETDDLVVHKNVVYSKVGDRNLHMDIFQPRTVSNAPVVMVIHGGGWLKGSKDKFHPLARYLAQYGFVTATVEYRLGTEALFPAAIQDCNTATRFLRKSSKQYSIDPTRIGAIGGSAGGHLVGLMATSGSNPELLGTTHADYSSALQSAIVLAGPLDLLTGPVAAKSLNMPTQSNSNKWIGKTVAEDPATYKLASPVYHINAQTCPTHFLLGEHDSPERNIASRHALTKLGIPSRLHVYRFGLHGCWNSGPWFYPLADDAARLFGRDLKTELATRPLQSGENITHITNHHEHLLLSTTARQDGKISIPRYHARIGLTYLKGDPKKTPLKVTPEIEHWDISIPADAHPNAEIIMELLDPAVTGALPSVVAQQGDSPINLNAHFAETYGEKLRFEPQPHKNTIGYWVNPEDWCRWRIYVETPGTYDLTIHQGCGKGHGGSEVAIKSAEQVIEFIVEDTGHFQNFKPRTIGQFRFDKPGVYNIDIRPIKKAKVAIMDVRLMELKLRK